MEFIRTFTQQFQVGERATLSFEGRSGAVSIHGEETDEVRIEVVARLWAESESEADDQAELIARGIRHEGERVTVRTPLLPRTGVFLFFGRGPRVDYQLSVPQRTKAQLNARSGRVEIANIAGPLQIESRSGRISIREIGADTSVVCRSGHLEIEEIAGSLSIESRSGKIQLRGCTGDVQIDSRSGALQIENPGGDVRVQNRSGSITISDAAAGVTVASHSGAVRYRGAIRGPFDIQLASGAVTLAVDPNDHFFLDAETTSGIVRSDLPLRHGGAGGGDGPTVRIRTRSGSIRIMPR